MKLLHFRFEGGLHKKAFKHKDMKNCVLPSSPSKRQQPLANVIKTQDDKMGIKVTAQKDIFALKNTTITCLAFKNDVKLIRNCQASFAVKNIAHSFVAETYATLLNYG